MYPVAKPVQLLGVIRRRRSRRPQTAEVRVGVLCWQRAIA